MATRGVFATFIGSQPNDPRPHCFMVQRAGKPDGQGGFTGYRGEWELVGGQVLEGETDEQALERLVLQETGWKIRSLGPVSMNLAVQPGVISSQKDDAQAYYCEIAGGQLKTFPTASHLDGRWVPLEDIFTGKIKIVTNPTSKGYLGRMAKMVLAGFEAHKPPA